MYMTFVKQLTDSMHVHTFDACVQNKIINIFVIFVSK